MNTLRRIGAHLAIALASGYLLFFYSERVFYGVPRPGDSLLDYSLTWAAYSAAGYLFLAVLAWLRVQGWSGLLVAGALFGWLIEGTWASTLYGTVESAPFPLSLIFTGVEWHGLITVVAGWYGIQWALRRGAAPTVVGALLFGLFWGAWATFEWGETPPVIVSPQQLLLFASWTSALAICAYALLDRLGVSDWRPNRWAAAALGVLHVVVFALWIVPPLGWWPLLVLGPLLTGGVWLLWRQQGEGPTVLESLAPRVPAARYALLAIMPLTATATYLAALLLGGSWPPMHMVLWVISGAAGTIALVVAVVRLLRRTRPAPVSIQEQTSIDAI